MKPEQAIVHIVDDDADVRDALRWLMESVRLQVCTYDAIDAFLQTYRPGACGCMVLDVRMPGMSGMEFLEHLDSFGVELPVIMLSGHATVAMATRAMRAGVVDFVQKPVNEQLLLDRVHEAIDLSLRRQLRRALSDRLATLTSREAEIALLIAAGLHNKQIAQKLRLSVRTVEAHHARAVHKLGLRSTAELVGIMVEHRVSTDSLHQSK